MNILTVTLAVMLFGVIQAKIYTNCELARELTERFKFPKADLNTWMCIAYWEGQYRTTPINKNRYDGSTDYGLFQINDKYWCMSDRGRSSNLCNMNCTRLVDDDIADDVHCIKEILRRQGFRAWVSFRHICYADKRNYLSGCDDPAFAKRALVLPSISIPKISFPSLISPQRKEEIHEALAPKPLGLHFDLSPSETQVNFGGPHGLRGHVKVQPFLTFSQFLGNMGLDSIGHGFSTDDDDDDWTQNLFPCSGNTGDYIPPSGAGIAL